MLSHCRILPIFFNINAYCDRTTNAGMNICAELRRSTRRWASSWRTNLRRSATSFRVCRSNWKNTRKTSTNSRANSLRSVVVAVIPRWSQHTPQLSVAVVFLISGETEADALGRLVRVVRQRAAAPQWKLHCRWRHQHGEEKQQSDEFEKYYCCCRKVDDEKPATTTTVSDAGEPAPNTHHVPTQAGGEYEWRECTLFYELACSLSIRSTLLSFRWTVLKSKKIKLKKSRRSIATCWRHATKRYM